MSRINDIYQQLQEFGRDGANAEEIGAALEINRSTASRYLNELVKANQAKKIPGKPVKYMVIQPYWTETAGSHIVGSGESLQSLLEMGMAAFSYPSKPLPILLTGETGTGKTYLAEKLSNMAIDFAVHPRKKFITFNCADYAQNPELLLGQIFGIKKGAFTGAAEDKMGLVEQADGGILFLDEIHRLPPSGQEMLFYLMDKGVYHRLGEATKERHADIALIGATTEASETYLLPTLLRRFSVKLAVPPLRERTNEEREALIEQFLSEEATKMKADISIEYDCRQAFLSYDCPGNIGQLKSDIQIACARAYLRYINKESDKVLIKLEDFPENLPVKKNDDNLNKPSRKIESDHLAETSSYLFPNIYQRLDSKNRHTDSNQDLQQVVLDYIRDLTEKYRQPSLQRGSWQQLMDEDLFQVLHNAVESLGEILPFAIQQSQLYVIGLHLQNYRNHLREEVKKEPIPVVIHPNPAYRKAASHLANQLRMEIAMDLPEEETELIAHFLTPAEETSTELVAEQELAVILVTHGSSTASSMAEVTNYLLGNRVIKAIDMPLNMAVGETYEWVKQTINRLSNIKGALLLVDIGSLITMGDTIQHELNVPIKTLSSVNLPMVLEAGRQSLLSDQTLDGMYEAAKKALTVFMDKDQQEKEARKKRLIATVCFTGEGAAQLLESWLENQLSKLDDDVIIRAVRIDPITKDTSVLNDLKNYYDVVVIIGTVPVSIEGIPYIPAWELLQNEGISRLHKLLEISRKAELPHFSEDISANEIYNLIIRGLQEITRYVNPKAIGDLLRDQMPAIRNYYGWDNSRELGMWMHIGSLIDRLISVYLKHIDDSFLSSIPLDNKTVPSSEEEQLWQPLFQQINHIFGLEIPSEIKKELIKLSR
jgi:transcriptional regulator with AAA-type ATPase domain/transcriptional regulatory protein LevR